MSPTAPVVDIHTHIYPPSYIALLKSRTSIPYIRSFQPDGSSLRLVILPAEDAASTTARGRPIGPEYYDIKRKIAFMDRHGIDVSVVSLANPWLDWLPPDEEGAPGGDGLGGGGGGEKASSGADAGAAATARRINDEVEALCAQHPGRLFAFGTLPLSAPPAAIVAEIRRLGGQHGPRRHTRGVVLGTTGLGAGLDDPALLPVLGALADAGLPLFLHPHYGLPAGVWGPRAAADYGHVLPLALGFPVETTVAVTRMILAGVFDALPALRVILAHSGGALPFLAARIESCIEHDAHVMAARRRGAAEGPGKHPPVRSVREVLRENIYLDAVVYGDIGVRAAVQASGVDRVMFGTDHPFFPPLGREDDEDPEWASVKTNVVAIETALGEGSEEANMVLGGNAIKVLGLDLS